MFKVCATQTFDKKANKLLSHEIIEKVANSVSKKPFSGRALGLPFLREKRIDDKRLYYLIYKEKRSVLFVAVSNKKEQQKTIDAIKKQLGEFKKLSDSFDFSFL